jgi:hypothetical protein
LSIYIYLSTISRKRFAFVSSAGHAIFPDHALERPLESAHRNAGRFWPHDPTWQAVVAAWAEAIFAIAATQPLAVLAS